MKHFAATLWLLSFWPIYAQAPLPVWQPDERKALESKGWVAGSLLLSDEPIPELKEEPIKELKVEQPKAEELIPEVPASVIPEKFLPQYFAEKPGSFLVDPQGLLSAEQARDRLEFLKYHSGDSSIDLYIYLFKGDQEIPGEVRQEEIVERFYSYGKPAAVVFYYLGAPQRSVLYLSPSLTEAVPAVEQRRALQSSVMQAFEKLKPTEQLEAFLVQSSIRVYWMERLLNAQKEEASPLLVEAAAPVKPVKLSFLKKHEPEIRAIVGKWAVPVSILIALLFAAISGNWWLRRNMRYRFPDFHVEPRLGGEHAAGVGAVISFASTALPPASQRVQVPDYLRRA